MADWNFSRRIWSWPYNSRSSKMWQVMHNDITSISLQSQVFIFNSYWHMADWKLSRPIWPWPNFKSTNVVSNAQWHHVHTFLITSLYLKRLLRYGRFKFFKANLTMTYFFKVTQKLISSFLSHVISISKTSHVIPFWWCRVAKICK